MPGKPQIILSTSFTAQLVSLLLPRKARMVWPSVSQDVRTSSQATIPGLERRPDDGIPPTGMT